MESAGKRMNSLVVWSQCSNCSHDLKLTVNVPEELKKVQEEKVKLTQRVQSLTTGKAEQDAKLAALTNLLEISKQAAAQAQEEANKQQAELLTKTKEHQFLQQQSASAKNIQAHLQSNVNALKKNICDMEKTKMDITYSMNSEANAKDESTVLQLKQIGLKFSEQKERVAALEEEKKKLEEKLAKKNSEGPSALSGAVSTTQGDIETHKLLEESMEKIITLETETEKLKAENEELQKTCTLKKERAKTVLITARAKIQKAEDEKKKLEQELEQIGESNKMHANFFQSVQV